MISWINIFRSTLIVVCLINSLGLVYGQNSKSVGDNRNIYTLERCIKIAIDNNPGIKIAEKQVEAQRAIVYGSYSEIMPRITATILNANRTKSGDTAVILDGIVIQNSPGSTRTNFNKSVGLTMPIYNGGRNWNLIRRNKQVVNNQEFGELNTINQVIVDVKTGFYTLLKAIRLKEVIEEQVRLNEQQLRMAESKYQIGSVAKVDVLQAKANLGNIRINLQNQRKAVLQARAELNSVMGSDHSQHIEIVDPLETKPIDNTPLISLEEALRKAELTNPAIQRDTGGIRSAVLQTKIARGGLWPTVSGNISYNRSAVSFQDVYGTYDKNWRLSFNLNLSLPILNGTQTYADISQAHVQRMIADETLRQTRRTTSLTIRRALLDLDTAQEVITLSNDNIVASEESLKLAEERYRIGSGTLIDVFMAQEALTRVKSELASSQYDYLIALGRLDGAIGRKLPNSR